MTAQTDSMTGRTEAMDARTVTASASPAPSTTGNATTPEWLRRSREANWDRLRRHRIV